MGLVSRQPLATVRSCYRYERKLGAGQGRLWSSVRAEIACFIGLLPLLVSDWALPCCRRVTSSDASPWGYGAVEATWDIGDVKDVGRELEKSRFAKGGPEARSYAFQVWAFLEGREDREEALRELDGDEGSPVASGSFKEVPTPLLEGHTWKVVDAVVGRGVGRSACWRERPHSPSSVRCRSVAGSISDDCVLSKISASPCASKEAERSLTCSVSFVGGRRAALRAT